jgi:hypothetical protein
MSDLYLLVPNRAITHKVVEELRARGLDDEDIGVIARDDIELEDLPEADAAEKSDVKPALKRGVATGGAAGLLAGIAVNVVPGGLALGGLALAGATLAGGAFGAWASSLVGTSIPNSELETFRDAINRGEILMIVRAGKPEHEPIRDTVTKHHPEVVVGGEGQMGPPLG